MKRRKFLLISFISTLTLFSNYHLLANKNFIKKVKIGNKYWILSSDDI